jgi:hypothetical protein
MYRLLPLDKDTYITDKVIAGSGSITSNVGQASSLDLFKIWSQVSSGSTPTIELSRILLHVDLDPLRALTGSVMDITDSSFKCYLSLKDIYGGQTTPSNFTLVLNPIGGAGEGYFALDWDEGRGSDIQAFRDLDAANWVTASLSGGLPTVWAVTGANGPDQDYITNYQVKQTFLRGDENLLMDVTDIVVNTLNRSLPDSGWRLAYSASHEEDDNSYFVKRFGSRSTTNPLLHPKLIVNFSDALEDDGNQAVFGQTNTIRTYRSVNGRYTNFVSGGSDITGNDCLKLVLVASKSINTTTSSWQQNFSASITYMTSSVVSYSMTFTGSQATGGNGVLTGYYKASVLLDPQTDVSLSNFMGSDKSVTFKTYWTSLDDTLLYSSGSYLTITLPESGESVVAERNFVVNVTNLKTEYVQSQTARLRVFIQERNTELPAFRLPSLAKSLIFNQMSWRLLNAFSRAVVIPFHSTATKLSSDGIGMYFDMYMQDLDPQIVYELEFQITENDRDYFIANEGFRFKVIP